MKIVEVIDAWGHENIRSTHKTTFQITKDSSITTRGNCIIAVNATKGARDLHPGFIEASRREKAKMTVIIETDEVKELIEAEGSPELLFTHPKDLVVRKSDYVCGRTVAIRANKVANDLPKKLVSKLQKPGQKIRVVLIVEDANKLLRPPRPAR